MQYKKKFDISWTDVNIFLQCSCCFYNLKHLKIYRPGIGGESFSIFKSIDASLKEEMDIFRGWKAHPSIMQKNGIDAMPFNDEKNSISIWKDVKANNKQGGIRLKLGDNIELYGEVDDVWINSKEELIIVEYKSTSKEKGEKIEQNSWYYNYKHQLYFYAWLFKMNGYSVHDTGYFVYCNGLRQGNSFLPFDNKLSFEVSLSPCKIDYLAIERVLQDIACCLDHEKAPKLNDECDYCKFVKRRSKVV